MNRLLCIALLMVGNCLGGDKQTKELAWAELGPAIASKKIQLVLPGGVEIQGNVLAVEAEALRLDVTKTSDKKAIRKGENSIPRQQVSIIRISRYSKRRRTILTPALPGLPVAGMIAALQAQSYSADPRIVVPVGMGAVAAGAIGGYYLGKHLDPQERTEIKIVR
jgi:hypothetical protein